MSTSIALDFIVFPFSLSDIDNVPFSLIYPLALIRTLNDESVGAVSGASLDTVANGFGLASGRVR